MVGCPAGFDPDHRRSKLLEESDHLLAPQLLTQNRFLGSVHPVKLEEMFRCIHSNSANLFHGRSPLIEICNDLILAQPMPSGAVHPNTPIYIQSLAISLCVTISRAKLIDMIATSPIRKASPAIPRNINWSLSFGVQNSSPGFGN